MEEGPWVPPEAGKDKKESSGVSTKEVDVMLA